MQFPPTLTQEQWLDYGKFFPRLDQARQWWLGDWWNAGVQWGNGKAACEALGIDYDAARKCGSIAARMLLLRRRNNLPFSHHQEVYAIDDPTPPRSGSLA
jgi:hypothetical protein